MIAGIVASMLRRPPSPPGELEGLLPNRFLGVLFYQGEKHPGSGPELSDTEWTVAPTDAVQMPSGDPYPGVIGQINYDLSSFILLAGGGAIQMLSGYWFHYLVQSGNVFQGIITTDELLVAGAPLDPAKQDAFNEWWDSKGPQKVELVDANGIVTTVNVSGLTTESGGDADPTQYRLAVNMEVPWANPGDIVTMRLVPI